MLAVIGVAGKMHLRSGSCTAELCEHEDVLGSTGKNKYVERVQDDAGRAATFQQIMNASCRQTRHGQRSKGTAFFVMLRQKQSSRYHFLCCLTIALSFKICLYEPSCCYS